MSYHCSMSADIYPSNCSIDNVYSDDFGPYETEEELSDALALSIDFEVCEAEVLSSGTIVLDNGGLQMRLMLFNGETEFSARAAREFLGSLPSKPETWQEKVASAANYLRRLTGK